MKSSFHSLIPSLPFLLNHPRLLTQEDSLSSDSSCLRFSLYSFGADAYKHRFQSHIATDSHSVKRSVSLGVEPHLGPYQILVSRCHLLPCPCGVPSATRGRVCRLSESLPAVISLFSQRILYLHFTCYYLLLLVIKRMYVKVPVSSGSVQQSMP
jgi:hypothetical protein